MWILQMDGGSIRRPESAYWGSAFHDALYLLTRDPFGLWEMEHLIRDPSLCPLDSRTYSKTSKLCHPGLGPSSPFCNPDKGPIFSNPI
ncbi:hypothetical protein Nepgr_024153 [Nepenthes gracilis]|uniref:Uncharacterized protein n=1 Tax=Nepenthes gracilis TaxID=150966 RepID=A0AAD3T2L7_NEPGR|nr:hypothetical protein Nepgr_024153 [Nepenthes gracilis]